MTGRRVIALVALAACAVLAYIYWPRGTPVLPTDAARSGAVAPATPDSMAAGHPGRPAGATSGATRAPTVPVLAHTTQPMHDLPPFKLPAGPLAKVLPDLKAAAERGDAIAAYTAYALLRDCVWQDTMADARDSVLRTQPPDSPVVKGLNEDMAATAVRCAGVTKPTIADQLPLLEKAAAGGNPYAQAAYANDALVMMRADPDWMLRNPEEVSRIEATGLDYLQQSANSGDRIAMLNLGIAYSSGVLAQPDPVLAYAYLYAGTNLGTAGGSETLMEQIASKLSPDELARAQTLAQQLHGQ